MLLWPVSSEGFALTAPYAGGYAVESRPEGSRAGLDLAAMLPALAAGADAHGDRPLVVDPARGAAMTWRELADVAERRAGQWRAAGAQPGRRLGLVLDPAPSVEGISALVAALATGAGVVVVNARFRPAERAGVLAAARPAVVVAATTPDDALAMTDAAPGDPADRLIVLSSGTSGPPKGVRHTAATLDASADAVAARFGFDADDVWMCPLPMVHVGGFATLWRVLRRSATLLLADPADVAAQHHLLAAADGPTHVSLVPTQLARLVAAGASCGPRLRVVQIGGSGVEPAMRAAAAKLGFEIVPTYGMTEMASTLVVDGEALDSVEIEIRDEAGGRAPIGAEGTVVVDGPMRSPGYAWGGPVELDGPFVTSDRGLIDADGRLHVLGRSDDMLIVGGENVHPLEIETVLVGHPGVREVLVFGVADAERGVVPVADVVAADPAAPPSADELAAFCRSQLAAYKVPRRFVLVDELPRNAMGKVLRPGVES